MVGWPTPLFKRAKRTTVTFAEKFTNFSQLCSVNMLFSWYTFLTESNLKLAFYCRLLNELLFFFCFENEIVNRVKSVGLCQTGQFEYKMHMPTITTATLVWLHCSQGFYPDTLALEGELQTLGEGGGLCPVQWQSPWSGVWGEAPRSWKAESFSLHK